MGCGIASIALTMVFAIFGTNIAISATVKVYVLLVLIMAGLIAGLVARFGKYRDNLGAAGIVLAITTFILTVTLADVIGG